MQQKSKVKTQTVCVHGGEERGRITSPILSKLMNRKFGMLFRRRYDNAVSEKFDEDPTGNVTEYEIDHSFRRITGERASKVLGKLVRA